MDLEAGTSGPNVLISIENATGGNFDDTLRGSEEDGNLLDGRPGSDVLIGGGGADTLVGGLEDVASDGGEDGVGFLLINENVATERSVLTEALEGNIYINVHSTDFPPGEVRGQLVLLSDDRDAAGYGDVTFVSTLDGAQEVPAVDTSSTGNSLVTFNVAVDGTVTYSINLEVDGVGEDDLTVLHFHNAPAGENGPVVTDLAGDAGYGPSQFSFEGTGFSATSEGDTLDLSGATEGVSVDLDVEFSGVSNPGLSQNGVVTSFGAGASTIEATDIENVIGSNFDDRIFGNAEENVLLGLDGDDTFHGFAGADTVDGGAGTDIFLFNQATGSVNVDLEAGTAGANVLISIEDATGGNFDDTLRGTDGANNLDGRSGDDRLYGGDGRDTLTGADGNDVLNGGDRRDRITGNRGNDELNGDDGSDILRGGLGNDEINGGLGRDNIRAGRGNDTIDGGDNDDVLRGGGGSDTFVFGTTSGDDRIVDFNAQDDSLDLTAFNFNTADAVLDQAVESGDSVIITLDDETTVTLQNVELSELSSSSFIL